MAKTKERAYCVKIIPTSYIGDTMCNNQGEYFECRQSEVIVVTDDPKKIYDKFGDISVVTIERIGIGYTL